MVFRGRNKAYGAYELRRLSVKYQIWSVGATAAFFSTFILFVHWGNLKEKKPYEFQFEKMVEFKGFDANLITVQPVQKEQAPPPTQKEEHMKEKTEDLPPEVVKDKPVEKIKDNKDAVVDTTTKKTDKEGTDSVKDYKAGADSGATMVKYEEGPASYYGGITEFNKWVSMNLRCPREVIESMMVQATVNVFFVIDIDGNVTNVRVLKGFNKECDEEVIRVIQSSPKWKPRVVNGIPAPQRYTVGIIINPTYYRNQNQYK